MEIILTQYVKGLGEKNDIVTVKSGYARNYLIPQKLAVVATKSAKKVFEENLRQASHRQEHIIAEAKKVADKIEALEVYIETLAGTDGKLFGSVTPLMIANSLEAEGIEVDRRRISLENEVRELGKYTSTIDLHKEVKASLTFQVIAKEK